MPAPQPSPHSALSAGAADTGWLGEPALCSPWKAVILGGQSIQVPHISHICESKIPKACDQAVTLRAEAGDDVQPTL